ncbi:hypothetical protein H6A16_09780 [Collinsella tanakaei]|uniref:DUF6054 family protein n=1 Tax=Collinsella tanakaei TaxID=626935 RepID=UPI00195A1209|nr:DUF6054 family protein [Collinsella tanakaei]MBM6779777.1 hypothetical protein [Collinsella tanakaei]
MVELEASLGFEDAKALVRRAITQLGVSVEVAGKLEHDMDGTSLYVVVIEKYFIRNGSYASLTIVVTGDDARSRVEAIPAGAGDGVFNIGFGAHRRFAEDFEQAMRDAGYE